MASCVQKRKRPQLQLHKLTEELVSINNWQLLMSFLGMEAFRIKIIEHDYCSSGLAEQKHQAFDKWLSMTPSACWKNVIEALRKEPMSEYTLALDLERKYAWTDPRSKSVTRNFLCLPHTNNRVNFIQSKKLEERHFYRVHSTGSVPLLRSRSELAGTVNNFSWLISNSKPINLTNFLRQIEESDSKDDFRVGIEARFGELNLKLSCDANKLRPRKEVIQMINDSRCKFQPRVETTDIDRLLAGRNFLAEIKSLRVTFEITGQDEGEFVAMIDEHDDIFHLDVVYRQPGVRNKARFNFAMTQRKYDFRIADASRSILHEGEKSTPSQIAREIASLIHRLGQKQLSLSVCGKANEGQSEWKIQHVRQCIQKQYEWRPEKKWILVRYDIGETAPSTIDDQTPINDHATITFPISKNEIELWGLKRFPKGAERTHLSKKKYYYCPEHGDSYEWTTDDIMRDFNDFLEESFVIALKLDRSL